MSLMEVWKAALRRIDNPTLYDRIEVEAAQSFVDTVRSGGMSVRRAW